MTTDKKQLREEFFKSLKVGDVLVVKWGATITAAKFYRLLNKKGKTTLIIEELEQIKDAKDCMTGYATPSDELTGEVIRVRLGKWDIDSFSIKDLPMSRGKVWDKKAVYYNHAD